MMTFFNNFTLTSPAGSAKSLKSKVGGLLSLYGAFALFGICLVLTLESLPLKIGLFCFLLLISASKLKKGSKSKEEREASHLRTILALNTILIYFIFVAVVIPDLVWVSLIPLILATFLIWARVSVMVAMRGQLSSHLGRLLYGRAERKIKHK